MDAKEMKRLAEMLSKTMNTVQSNAVQKEVNKIPDSSKPVPNNAKKSLFSGVGTLLKQAAPIAASFIPGVGPVASQLLSTLNDDSWFEEYTSAGAAFNEKLVTKVKNIGTNANAKFLINARGAIASIKTLPRFIPTEDDVTAVQYEVGSSIIAYIRKQTNNVLADDIQAYYNVIDAYMQLYAIHFQLVKWIKFSQKQPLNIPMPSEVVQMIKPQHLNLLMGISESLKQYLQATVKLPYPLVEAIRWRFGTLFHTFNTGQPGLISYDCSSGILESRVDKDYGAITLQGIANDIKRYQRVIAESGRAGGDVTLAYANQINRLDVEDPHYDEKEFNLRHNIMFYGYQYPLVDLIPVIKDSRLATSPAIQASLLSLSIDEETDLALFACNEYTSKIAYYVERTAYADNNPHNNLANAGVPSTSGWHLTGFKRQQDKDTIKFRIDNAKGPGALTLPAEFAENGRAAVGEALANNFDIAIQRSMGFYKTPSTQSMLIYKDGVSNDFAKVELSVDQISYDLALLSPETVRAIQSAALRNLFRGNMPGPKPDITVSEVKPAVTEVAKAIDTLKA